MNKDNWNVQLLNCYKVTIDILERIKSGTIYKYKKLRLLTISDYLEYPEWVGVSTTEGDIKIGYNNDPQAIAHELGHGLHEKIRDQGKRRDCFGEDFAEAIRYYTETEICPTSEWLKNFTKDQNPFTCKYDTVEQFIDALKSGSMFTDVSWN